MRPRDSSLSTMPVTFEASQGSASASVLIGKGRSRVRNAIPCEGVRSSSWQSALHQSRTLKQSEMTVAHESSDAPSDAPRDRRRGSSASGAWGGDRLEVMKVYCPWF